MAGGLVLSLEDGKHHRRNHGKRQAHDQHEEGSERDLARIGGHQFENVRSAQNSPMTGRLIMPAAVPMMKRTPDDDRGLSVCSLGSLVRVSSRISLFWLGEAAVSAYASEFRHVHAYQTMIRLPAISIAL